MQRVRLLALCAVILGIAGCGAEKDAGQMPDVTGLRLDKALAVIESAGFMDDVDVTGGGLFGVVVESNWQVCEQSPARGEKMTTTPRLTVDRTCGGDPEESPGSAEPTLQTTPPAESAPDPDPTTSEPGVLTAATNSDLAAVFADPDYCSDRIADFADKYAGRTIEFDGSIVAMNNHGSYNTRYDILIAAGDFSENSQPGPAFQFRDVNTVGDLHWTNDSPTSTVGIGDNLHIVAEVGTYDANRGCLFMIEPIATTFR
ncbi:hypothetical protein CUD01_17930 [Cellulomonas uda]|uniref:Uncharacterized protein n=1 Tax=Cellulomonas uda TaxID=1714 RepID=A0A4Y3KA42_CELUD|nr:hypothetical protein CUD01_17930 [Cellulomonas uda]